MNFVCVVYYFCGRFLTITISSTQQFSKATDISNKAYSKLQPLGMYSIGQ